MTDETLQAEAPAEPEVKEQTVPEVKEAEATATVEASEETTETTGDIEEPEKTEEGEEEPRKKVTGSQRLKRKLALAESALERLERENAEYRQRLQGNPDGKPGIDRAPTEADFPDDYFAFERAKAAWDTRQAIREEIGRDRERDVHRARNDLQNERLEVYEEYAETVRERIPDFDKVVQSAANVEVKPELADEILASDKSALLQYHLAKNPDKVRELNGMNGRELAREIGRLEARIHLPQPKRATGASPPPSHVRGGAAPAFDPAKTDDMEAFSSWLKADLEKRGAR